MIRRIFRNIFGCSNREKQAQEIDQERARIINRELPRMQVRVRTAERLVESLKRDQAHANH